MIGYGRREFQSNCNRCRTLTFKSLLLIWRRSVCSQHLRHFNAHLQADIDSNADKKRREEKKIEVRQPKKQQCSVRLLNFNNLHGLNSVWLFQFNKRLVIHRKECIVFYLYRTINTVQTFFEYFEIENGLEETSIFLGKTSQVEKKHNVITLTF